jgi:predicted component of viral defense system (DUF524 family)
MIVGGGPFRPRLQRDVRKEATIAVLNVILWALATGAVTGGVWTAVVLWRRHVSLAFQYRELMDDRGRILAAVEELEAHNRELEERLEFVERLIARSGNPDALPPAD